MWSIRTFNDYEERPTKGKPWSVNSFKKKIEERESSFSHGVVVQITMYSYFSGFEIYF